MILLLALVAVVPAASAADNNATATLTITGMHCTGCAKGVTAMLKRTEGVVAAETSYEKKEALVTYDATKTTPAKLVEAIEKLGYKAEVKGS